MGLVRFYLHKGKLVIPTVCETEAGFYVDQGPIAVTPIKDKVKLKHAIVKLLNGCNKKIPTPEATDTPGSIILERLVIDTWTEFEKAAVLYSIHTGARYIMVHVTGKGPDGMWTYTNGEERKFDPRAPLDCVADAVIDDIKRKAAPAEEPPKKPMLLLPGPKNSES